MKIGVFTVLFSQRPLEDVLDYLKDLGVEAVEIGTGNYPGSSHCKLEELLEDDAKCKAFKQTIERRQLFISALSCHGNPLHPNSEFASRCIQTSRKTIELAAKLGVDRVIDFSGCPGDSDNAVAPNWSICPWPDDYAKILEWQWKEKVIPYWKEQAKIAEKYNVKICLEMHPGFVVYNPETLLKLREACGEAIGANFDPSHLFWQGINIIAAIRKLGPAIYHVHAKDTKIDPINVATNGVLDTKHYSDEINRAWVFRTVGYGHSFETWSDIVSALRLVGYDYVLSIEHEDSLMSIEEGLKKAINFLKQVVIKEERPSIWWA